MSATALLSSDDAKIDDRGDFVDSEDECDVEEVTENPIRYIQGVYYPICIGDVLANQYRVEHKLGHGGFSTVWMAHDTVNKVDVALKIIKPGESGEYEYSIQNEIVTAVGNTPLLLLYRKTFFLDSPHGQHRVLVFPVQGPNFREYACQTPFAARMSALRQLLQSLKCLHDAGFIHRGSSNAARTYALKCTI
jgi:serine/threonine protein kinase